MTEPVPPAQPAQPGPLTGLDAPPENVQRGVAFALIVVPLGIIAWDILWGVGFVVSLVAFGIAWGALRLYRIGSNGVFGRSGAIAVAVITVATLVLAFVSGYAVEIVGPFSKAAGTSIPESLVDGRFWGIVVQAMTTGQALISLLIAAAFGALGCFTLLRAGFRATRPGAPYAQAAGAPAPSQPGVDPNVPPVPPAPRRLMQEDDDPKA
jgi:hypothetical protein